jgi:lipoprotein-releasing system permease protein
MAMYEWLLGTRYLRSTRRRGFLSLVAAMAGLGLTLGVAVLIVVLSVMNGFERELRSRILSVTSHATLTGLDGALPDWRAARAAALTLPSVRTAVPFIEAQAMIARGSRVLAAAVRGVDPSFESRSEGLATRLQQASLEDLVPGGWRIVLGSALARELGIAVGDDVIVMAPEATATPDGIKPRMRRFAVVGLFESGMYEFDRGLALVHMADAARLYRLGDRVTGVRLELDDPFAAPQTVRELALRLGGGFFVSDWTRNHANFFRSIELTKSVLFVILLMIVLVAAFNIVATLVMIVKEKQAEIAILRTLGAGPRNILATFALQGTMIGLGGTVAGTVLGCVLALNVQSLVVLLERLVGFRFLDEKIYYMSELPAFIEGRDVVEVTLVAFGLCALATVYPAWRASRTAPAEALRRE